jgi:cytochrome c2
VIAAFLLGIGLSFVYGLLVAKDKIFPYEYIHRVYGLVTQQPGSGLPRQLEAIHLTLNMDVKEQPSGFAGYGGGIAVSDDLVIGADATGRFFYLDGDTVKDLDITPDLNRDAMVEYIGQHVETASQQLALERFRVLDLDIRDADDSTEIYMTHHYWDSQREAKTTRLSRLIVEDLRMVATSAMSYQPGDWELIYECAPVFDFTNVNPSPFFSNRSGGRIAIGDDGGIYVAFGDQRFDGIGHPFMAPQEDDTCFGKVVRFDPESREMLEIARGLRNPQGLMFDFQGRLWSSDHGPRGGDELNLINPGENYGWPHETLGTSYDPGRKWPLAVEPGRHRTFQSPVYAWLPSIGTSAILQIGDEPSEWSGDLLLGSLVGGSLHHMRMGGDRIIFEERIAVGERIRDLVQLSDGAFVLWTDTPRLLELRKADRTNELQLSVLLTSTEKARGLEEAIAECASCHALNPGESGGVAPSLWGVYGRTIAATDFGGYSLALRNRRGVWNEESIASYLEDPQAFANGTTMRLDRPMDDSTRQMVIGYLKRLTGP